MAGIDFQLTVQRSSVYEPSGGVKRNKESRPLSEKSWQRDVIRELVEFCLSNGYPNTALSPKDFFPINTGTFR